MQNREEPPKILKLDMYGKVLCDEIRNQVKIKVLLLKDRNPPKSVCYHVT